MQLIEELEAHKDTQRRLDEEIALLPSEYSKINDALAQRLLSESLKRNHFGTE
jgi:hypothetical protein